MMTRVTESMAIYMSYLLRYAPHFPITNEQLQKMAESRHFARLANYLGELPPEHTYNNSAEVMRDFKATHTQE